MQTDNCSLRTGRDDNIKQVSELARALLNFKRPTGLLRTAIEVIIRSFTWGGLRHMLLLPEFLAE